VRDDVVQFSGNAGALLDDCLPRAFAFGNVERLVRFQSDMEALLLRTGWTFSRFAPDRRSNRDRRAFPRLLERRRWWTDGVRLVSRLRGDAAARE